MYTTITFVSSGGNMQNYRGVYNPDAVKRESLLPQFLRFGRIVGHEREEQIRRAKLSAGEKHHARKVNEANS
jgi:hypothetical protein